MGNENSRHTLCIGTEEEREENGGQGACSQETILRVTPSRTSENAYLKIRIKSTDITNFCLERRY